jgi:hypothetical protein
MSARWGGWLGEGILVPNTSLSRISQDESLFGFKACTTFNPDPAASVASAAFKR